MGMLALAGAVGGVGKGIETNAAAARDAQNKQLEEAREMRLRQYEAEQAAKRQQAGFGHEESMQGKAFAHEDTSQQKVFGQQTGLQEGQQKFTSSENQKTRASNEKIAGIRAQAANARARASAKGKRWESKVTKTTTIGANNMPIEQDVLSIFDKNSARTYLQEGDKFFPQGAPKTIKVKGADGKTTEQPIKNAARSQIELLLKNPDQADNFVRTYGYLPYEFFNGMDTAPAESTDTTTDETDNADDYIPAQ